MVRKIAVTGKGGTGKTVLATLMIHLLADGKRKVLAIDADSAMSLPYTLGISVPRTVSGVRSELIGSAQAKKALADGGPTKSVMKEILARGEGFDLLAMGRPEEPGCFCTVNDLLRFGIDSLADEYDIVIIDGEAGPEQLNRRVLKHIDLLLVVSDMSARSLETAAGILRVAESYEEDARVRRTGLVLNRVRGDVPSGALLDKVGAEVFGSIPEDEAVNRYDREGMSLRDLPADGPAMRAVSGILERAGVTL
ncbi:MAG: AAA family ATPase [Clostridiales Family XIII bacterium]|jgi:CO dehydrogenase maturation factor|nr:AAA family ATPase [Clostridiales Family XIII bacterium]